jgi:hypothetical protein
MSNLRTSAAKIANLAAAAQAAAALRQDLYDQ